MTDLRDKVVWVTGASGGIGAELAVQAARRGARVVLTARREAALHEVLARFPEPARGAVLPADLLALGEDGAEALAARAAQPFGPVDILVNNAGVSQRSLVRDTPLAVYRRIMELDFFAPVALTGAVLPAMLERGAGHVVMISSVVAKFGPPRRSGYAAAKHALHGYTESARAELWDEGIRFTLACPGFVRTQVSVNAVTASGEPWGQMDAGQEKGLAADKCAERVWRAVRRNREEVAIGRESVVVYLKRFFPGLVSRVLRRVKV